MRRLLGIICRFRGHKPMPCTCILCRMGTFGLHAHHCQRCGKLLWLGPVWDNAVIEWVDDDEWRVDDDEPYLRPLEAAE